MHSLDMEPNQWLVLAATLLLAALIFWLGGDDNGPPSSGARATLRSKMGF